jgi:hypothetical protein
MITDGGLGERRNGSARPAVLLDLCDRALGEIGRRQHLFGWLRAPGAEDWVPVDAYYPGNRLVVICREQPSAGDDLIETSVPAHRLRLLWLSPADFPDEPGAAMAELELELAELGPAPERPTGGLTEERPSAVAQAVASLAQARANALAEQPVVEPRSSPAHAAAAARAARFAAAHHEDAERGARAAARHAETLRKPARTRPLPTRQPHRRRARPVARRTARAARTARPARPVTGLGAFVPVVMVIAVAAEMYFGVARWALAGGHLLLAVGIALDAGARTLGTIAAGSAGDTGSAWACALGGSPFVAAFALFGEDGPVATDPAPFAGLLGLTALAVLAVAVVAAALGG